MKNKWLIFICIIALTSCKSNYTNLSKLPQQYLLKGIINDSTTLYLSKTDVTEGSLGYYFVDRGKAIADINSFSVYSPGHIALYTSNSDTVKGEIKKQGNKGYRIKFGSKKRSPFGKSKILLKVHEIAEDEFEFRERYIDPITDSIITLGNIHYGDADGYYTTYNTEHISTADGSYSGMMDQILTVYKDSIIMGKSSSQKLLLDLYYPNDGLSQKLPLVVYLHGGAFLFGNKETQLQEILTEELVKKGYILASINYRLGLVLTGFGSIERAIYRGVQDTRAALRFLVANNYRLRIDTDQIYLCGSSAGGIIALTTTYMDQESTFRSAGRRLFQSDLGGLDQSGNNITADFKIAGVIGMWGALVDMDIIGDKGKPTLLFHGTDDDIVPAKSGLPFKKSVGKRIHNILESAWTINGSESIDGYLNKHNVPSEYVSFEGYGHEPQLDPDGSLNANCDTIRNKIRSFLYDRVSESLPFSIDGSATIRANDPIPRYSVYPGNFKNIRWEVKGGTIISSANNTIDVIWHPRANSHSIRAYILDSDQIGIKKELSIKLNRP